MEGEGRRRGGMSNASVIVMVVMALMGVSGCQAWDCSPSDRGILLSFSESFVDPSGVFQSWNSSNANCCTWEGVSCRESDGAVVELKIVGNSAPGTQPYRNTAQGSGIDGLSGLSQLQKLTIQWVLFNEAIPSSWGGGFSSNLVYITINDANLRDDIPSNLANLQGLQHLDLKDNHLTGSIPSSFCSAQHLTYIDVSYNDMNYILVPACLQGQKNVTIVYSGQGQSTSPGARGAGSVLSVATSVVLAFGALSTGFLFL